ncbi:MAG TPA: DUF4340 domain-containing protein [Deltaproteobacteria bacterium]|nr:DUF4340 domain-containing protein [Deltaproteobacteria bacterium]
MEEISISGTDSVTLSKRGLSWWITAPVEIPADPREIEGLLADVYRLKSRRTLENPPSLVDAGLDPPGLILGFRTKEREILLNIGNANPTKQYCYARSSASPEIFLINAYEKSRMDKDLFTLRDKHVLKAACKDITKISIKRHGLIMEYQMHRDGRWHLLEDHTAKLKTERLNDLLVRLCRTQAKAFIDDTSVSGNPDIIIELFKRDGSEVLKI